MVKAGEASYHSLFRASLFLKWTGAPLTFLSHVRDQTDSSDDQTLETIDVLKEFLVEEGFQSWSRYLFNSRVEDNENKLILSSFKFLFFLSIWRICSMMRLIMRASTSFSHLCLPVSFLIWSLERVLEWICLISLVMCCVQDLVREKTLDRGKRCQSFESRFAQFFFVFLCKTREFKTGLSFSCLSCRVCSECIMEVIHPLLLATLVLKCAVAQLPIVIWHGLGELKIQMFWTRE